VIDFYFAGAYFEKGIMLLRAKRAKADQNNTNAPHRPAIGKQETRPASSYLSNFPAIASLPDIALVDPVSLHVWWVASHLVIMVAIIQESSHLVSMVAIIQDQGSPFPSAP